MRQAEGGAALKPLTRCPACAGRLIDARDLAGFGGETTFEEWSATSTPTPAAHEQTSGALLANAPPTGSSSPMAAYTPMINWQDDPR